MGWLMDAQGPWITLLSPQHLLYSALSRYELEPLEEFVFCG